MLKDRALLDQQEQVLEELGKGKRSRKQVLQTGLLYEQDDDLAGMVEISSDEEADWTPPVQPELPIVHHHEIGELTRVKKPLLKKRPRGMSFDLQLYLFSLNKNGVFDANFFSQLRRMMYFLTWH